MARQDPLTGLGNRAPGAELDRMILRSQRSLTGFALLYIDLDYFKQINDSFGHGLGDLLLAVIANRLRRTMRQDDLIARIGGDEFVALLNDLHDPNDAALIASKIIHALSEPVTLGGHHLLVSASVGIATYPSHGATAAELLQHADQALYRQGQRSQRLRLLQPAKRRRHPAQPGHRAGPAPRPAGRPVPPALSADCRYPQRRHPVPWEALLRWKHPQLGLLTPDAFLKLAEHSGLILPMGHWVIGQALEAVRQWLDAGIQCRLSINLSDRELKQPRFAEQLRQCWSAVRCHRR